MKVAVIGAGEMGVWFTKYLLSQRVAVVVSDINAERLVQVKKELVVDVSDNATAVENADIILLCVPISRFEDVVREIHSLLKPTQAVIDTCSIKELPVRTMHKYMGKTTVLGMHPMFGPSARRLRGRKFILTPTTSKERRFANCVKKWLEKTGGAVTIMSPKEHDELMSVVLGLSQFVGMVAYETLADIRCTKKAESVSGPSFELLSALARKVVKQNPTLYAELQVNLPRTREIEALFCNKAKKWLNLTRTKNIVLVSARAEHLHSPVHSQSGEEALSAR